MTIPADFTQLDLQNLPPEKAAELARAQQLALAQRQQTALAGILSAMPEAQKAGALEYEQAGKEREGGQRTAANVFKIALGEKEAATRLKELQLQGAQLREMIQQHGLENLRQDYNAYLSGLHTAPPGLVEREGKTAGEVANIENITTEAGKIPIIGGLAAPVGRILGAGKRAELQATEKEKEKGGYRTEAPLSFEEFIRGRLGGGKGRQPAAKPPAAAPPSGGDMVSVQVPGHPPGSIHRSQLPAFKAKFPNAVVGQ